MFDKIMRGRNYLYVLLVVGIFVVTLGDELWPTWYIDITLFIAQILILRWFVTQQVHKRMMAESHAQTGRNVPELESEEIKSTGTLKFLPTDAFSTSPQFVETREFVIQNIRSVFNKSLLLDAGAALGYIFIPLVLSGNNTESDNYWGVVFIGIFILFSIVLRFLFLRNQFRPSDSTFKTVELGRAPIIVAWQGVTTLLRELAVVLERGLQLVIAAWLGIMFLFSAMSAKEWGLAAGLLAAGALHFYLFRLSRPKNDNNIKLLVLRTFGLNENAMFVFGRLLAFWQHVGNFFTIVDSSYLNHNYRPLSRRSLGVMVLLGVLTFSLMSVLQSQFGFQAGTVLLYIFGFGIPLLAMLAFEYYMINRNFVQSREIARARFESVEKHPRQQFGILYRGVPTMCHDNTWQATVAEMVNIADVVLMDLRGFSEKKKGCEYEIDYLMDNIAIEQVVFIISTKDDLSFIHRTFLERWEYLRKHSPNLDEPGKERDHFIQLYISDAQDEADVQGVFDYALGTAWMAGRIQGSPATV